MPRFHVHVPYPRFFEFEATLREHALSVELYLGTQSIDSITGDDISRIKDALGWEHTLSVHGPFMDLSPGAIDPKIAAVSLGRYLQVLALTEALRPEVVVFHSGYDKWKYDGDAGLWLEASIRTWTAVMDEADRAGVKVAIENITDEAPGHLVRLVEGVGRPGFGLCLDVGHREVFSTLPIDEWVEGMHPHIFELHLHDNDGSSDEHKAIGEGRVDFGSLIKKLKALRIDPVYTVEATSARDALTGLEYLEAHV